jgi:hypothetical protein
MFNTNEDQNGNISYNAYQHAIAEAPNSTQVITPKTTVKRSPDFQPPSTRDFLLVPC